MTAGSRIIAALIVLAFIGTGLYYLVVSGDEPAPGTVPAAVTEPAPAATAPRVRATPAVPAPRSSESLSFRVIVSASDPDGLDLDREQQALEVSGPIALPGAPVGWYPVHDLDGLAQEPEARAALERDPVGYLRDRFGMVAGTHEDALYVLLHTTGGRSLAPARRRGVDVVAAELATAPGVPALEVTLGQDTAERLKMLVRRNESRTWAVLVDSVVVEFTRLDDQPSATLAFGTGMPPEQLEALRAGVLGTATISPARFVASTPAPAAGLLLTSPTITTPGPAAPIPTNSPAAPAATPEPASAGSTTYTVRTGDTLSSIAERTYGSESRWTLILGANPGLDPDRLQVGQVLRLPDASAAARPATVVGAGVGPATSATPTPGATYRVGSGDTLSHIAQRAYGSAKYWELIYEANRSVIGSSPADLSVGMTLRIPLR